MQTAASSSTFDWNFWGEACLRIGKRTPPTFKQSLILHLTFITTGHQSARPERQCCLPQNSFYLTPCQTAQVTADCLSPKYWSCLTFYFFQLVLLPRLGSFFLSLSPTGFIVIFIFICRNIFRNILGEDSCWGRIRFQKTESYIQHNSHRKKKQLLFPQPTLKKSIRLIAICLSKNNHLSFKDKVQGCSNCERNLAISQKMCNMSEWDF